jgi:5-methylcytosine-specific restriction endonuclease McrA
LPGVARMLDSPRSPAQCGALKPLSADRFSVNFTADAEFRELLDDVRALLSHSQPKGELLNVMKRGLEALRGELLKKRFGVGRKPRRVRATTVSLGTLEGAPGGQSSKRTRHVAAAVSREVYIRDQGRCTFCAEDGRRCGERRLLQLDHLIPHAEGGGPTVANLRLRCRAHNLHAARTHFGKEYVRAAAERARRRGRKRVCKVTAREQLRRGTRCSSSPVSAPHQIREGFGEIQHPLISGAV